MYIYAFVIGLALGQLMAWCQPITWTDPDILSIRCLGQILVKFESSKKKYFQENAF